MEHVTMEPVAALHNIVERIARKAYVPCCVVDTEYTLVVNAIVLTAGKAVNVNWLRQSASIRAVIVTEDVEKVFASAQQDGQEKVVTKEIVMTKSVLATEVVKTHNASAILDGLDVTVKEEILC